MAHRPDTAVPALRTLGVLLLLSLFWPPAALAEAYRLRLVNVSRYALRNHPVTVPLERLPRRLRTSNLRLTGGGGREIPSQVDDLDEDGSPDELAFLLDIGPHERRVVNLEPAPPEQARKPLPANPASNRIGNGILSLARRDLRWAELKTRSGEERLAMLTGLRYQGEKSREDRKTIRWKVLTTGPVRAILQVGSRRRREDSDLRIIQRYVLYRGRATVHKYISIQNLTDWQQKIPRVSSAIAFGGSPLGVASQSQEKPRRHKKFMNNRLNKLWLNSRTGYGVGIVMHSPDSWKRIMWKPGANRLVLTNLRRWHTGTFKGYYRHRPLPPLGRGETRTFGASYCFYLPSRVSPEDAEKQFKCQIETTVGVINVHGPEGEVIKAARAPLYIDEAFGKTDRWFTTQKADLKATGEGARLSADAPGEGMFTALRRDFRDPTELRGRISAVSAETAVRFVLQELESGAMVDLGTAGAGNFRLPMPDRMPEWGDRSCTLHARLVSTSGRPAEALSADIERLRFGWPLPEPPEFRGPPEGARLTDVGVAFGLHTRTREACERGYEIQVARDPEFEDILARYHEGNYIKWSNGDKDEALIPETLYEKGRYFCRARAISVMGQPGPWNETRSFTVAGKDHTPRPPVWKLSGSNPLFLVAPGTGWIRRGHADAFWDSLPPELRRHFAFQCGTPGTNIYYEGGRAEKNIPLIKGVIQKPVPNLSLMEQRFQEGGQLLGYWFNEAHPPAEVQVRGLKLAARYGRFAGACSGMYGMWDSTFNRELYEALERYGDHFLLVSKTQHPGSAADKFSIPLGLWLTGRTAHWGVETEWYVPRKVAIPDSRIEGIDWMPPFLTGLAGGAEVWFVTAFFGAEESHRGWNPEAGTPDVAWTDALRPFFQDILAHELIPSREAVAEKVRVALQGDPEYPPHGSGGKGLYPRELLSRIHGEPDAARQWVPQTPRYFVLPMISPYATRAECKLFDAVVKPERFATVQEAHAFLNRYYPPARSEAFAVLVGDTVVVTNSREVREKSSPQGFRVELTKGPVEAIEGEVTYHQYLIARQSEGRLFIHANNYPGEQSRFTLWSSGEVPLRVEPKAALAQKSSAPGGEKTATTLTLTHAHQGGVARVFVEAAR